MSKIKRIDIKEFREKGYLQEVNRLFFHPLGLALEVIINKETGEETLGGIWDYRDDPEGMYYAINDPKFTNGERLKEMQQKCDFVAKEREERHKKRFEALGFIFEPIPPEICKKPKPPKPPGPRSIKEGSTPRHP